MVALVKLSMQMIHCIWPIFCGPDVRPDCCARTAAAVWVAASSSSAEGASFVRSRCSIEAEGSGLKVEGVALRRLLLWPGCGSVVVRLRVLSWRGFEDESSGEGASFVKSTMLSPSHCRRVLAGMFPDSKSVSPSLKMSSMSMPSLMSSESNEGEVAAEGVKRRPGVYSPRWFRGWLPGNSFLGGGSSGLLRLFSSPGWFGGGRTVSRGGFRGGVGAEWLAPMNLRGC